jgi:hypothetical protein
MSFPSLQVLGVLEPLLQPTDGEVVRAKQALLKRLSNGKPHAAVDLAWILTDEEGLPQHPPNNTYIEIAPNSDIKATLSASDPLIASQRLKLATRIAIAELAIEGLIIEIKGPQNEYTQVPVRQGSQSGGARVAIGNPELGSGYQLARRFSSDILPILDPDIFTADLSALMLDDRMKLCIEEALKAHRHGLYLSCVNLLGSVSEGAWWLLAERLRGRSKDLDEAIDDDRTGVAQIIKLASEEISKMKGKKTISAELFAHATYIRELRNYGAHPRAADPKASHEHAFTEAGCSVLLLSTHHYLERLGSIVP